MRKSTVSRLASRRTSGAGCALCCGWRHCELPHAPGEPCDLVRWQRQLERGAVLFRQGERFGALYVLHSGCLTQRETMSDGTERVVGFRTPGELVGLEGWARRIYPHTVNSAAAATVCRLRWPQAHAQVPVEAAALKQLLAKAAEQLDRAGRPWAGLPASARVVAFMEDFIARLRLRDATGAHASLPITRAQIGSYLGLAEETVVRALAALRPSVKRDGAAVERAHRKLGPDILTARCAKADGEGADSLTARGHHRLTGSGSRIATRE
jgi:CRP/FNR family transcriptional regulator, anaerobic regulatory protein